MVTKNDKKNPYKWPKIFEANFPIVTNRVEIE